MSAREFIALEDLSEFQRDIADLIGLENYIKLAKRYGGDDIYIQKYSELLRPNRDREIMDKFNGYNYSELAAEYNLSTRTIYNLVSHLIRRRKNAPIDGQLSFEENP